MNSNRKSLLGAGIGWDSSLGLSICQRRASQRLLILIRRSLLNILLCIKNEIIIGRLINMIC